MPGISGQFFKNFGITVVIAVLMSLAVARLITPMLAAYFLKSKGHASHGEGPTGAHLRVEEVAELHVAKRGAAIVQQRLQLLRRQVGSAPLPGRRRNLAPKPRAELEVSALHHSAARLSDSLTKKQY